MKRESNRRNALEHVPTCSTWPPPWLAESIQPAGKPPAATTPPRVTCAETNPPEPPSEVSPGDLPPDLYELREERAAIMHFDGGIPVNQAEALALAHVLCQADPPAGKGNAAAEAEKAAAAGQSTLFGAEGNAGPYGRGL